jgi:hypothetical protein
VVDFSSSQAAAVPPQSITVPQGETGATFVVKTMPVVANVRATVSAKSSSKTLTATVSIKAPIIKAFKLSPTTIQGGASVDAVVFLSSPAPAGLTVGLKTDDASVQIPASAKFSAGATDVLVSVRTTATVTPFTAKLVATPTSSTITVPKGKSSITFQVTPAPTKTTQTVQLSAQVAGTAESQANPFVVWPNGLAAAPWPSVQADNLNSGRGVGSGATGVVKWKTLLAPVSKSFGTPVIGADGTIRFSHSTLRPVR